jgi:hypothetical protein
MKQARVAIVAVTLLATIAGCHSAEHKRQREEKLAQEQAAMKAAIPADSPLAKVDFGMTESQVRTLLGEPSAESSHITGKQFIPFNFAAKDTARLVYYYKGVGRVEFSFGSWGQRNGVVKLEPDANEPGTGRAK